MNCLHFDEHRLNDVLDGSTKAPDFRRYDDIDAVCDVPAALFYHELMTAYPDAKVILTIRDVDSWWRSIRRLYTDVPVAPQASLRQQIAKKLKLPLVGRESEGTVFRRNLRYCAFGSPVPIEHLYKRTFLQHNAAVVARTPPDRLLIMDVTAGDGWEKLCAFLGVPVPSTPFPSENRSNWPAAGWDGATACPPSPQHNGQARRPEYRVISATARLPRFLRGSLKATACLVIVAAIGLLAATASFGCGVHCGVRALFREWTPRGQTAALSQHAGAHATGCNPTTARRPA